MPNNWPGEPGVPEDAEKDGWHWLRFVVWGKHEPVPFFWSHENDEEGEWQTDGYTTTEEMAGSYCYLGPCTPPTQTSAPDLVEAAAKIVEARADQVIAVNTIRVVDIDYGKQVARLLRDVAKDIRAIPRTQADTSDGWLPIESAPFDCSVILRTTYNKFVGIADSEDEDAKHFPHGKHWVISDGKNSHPLRGPYPTHWRPLPAPPRAQAEGEVG